MKEFLKILKQTEKVTRCNFYMNIGECIVGVVCGGLISLDILFRWGVKNHNGALMVLIFSAIELVVYGFGIFPGDFQRALSMGKVRKYLFFSNYLLWLRNTLMVLLIALGVSVVEEQLYSRLVPEAIRLLDMRWFLGNPLIFVTIMLCAPALILFMGGMVLRFGAMIFGGILGVYLICIGFSKWKEQYPDCAVMKWLGISGGEPNIVGICLLCLLCGVIMLGLSWLVLRKQRVII